MGQALRRVSASSALLLAATFAFGQDLQPRRDLKLLEHLPRDPLAVWAADIGSGAEVYDGVLGLVRKVMPEPERAELDQALAEVDSSLGLKLRDDLLAHLGPEMAVAVDLPPIDAAAGAVLSGAPGSMAAVLGKIGIWVQVRDRDKVDQALRALGDRAGLVASEEGGLVRLRMPREKSATGGETPAPDIEVLYAIADNVLAIGFAPERVLAMVKPAAASERLADGGDFRRVFAHLDHGATSVIYVNLPRLQDLLRGSQMVQSAVAGQEDLQPVAQLLLDPSLAASGYGVTAVPVEGGVRQVTYGPSWTSGSLAAVGMLAAVAVPNLREATSYGRQRRTMNDIRSLATALEAYAIDHNAYPSTGAAWVDAITLTDKLLPDYIRTLPATDGWDNPLRVWTDGEHYRIVSPGKDGAVSAEWSGQVESTVTTDFGADIVYGDGEFLVYPEGRGN
jgi:hypothetical protein